MTRKEVGVIAYSIVVQGNVHKYIKICSENWMGLFVGFDFILSTHL